MENAISYVFFGVFAILVGILLYRAVKFRSLKSALFGAPIVETFGEASGANVWGLSTIVRVHSLKSPIPYRAVAVEMITNVATNFHTVPLTLSREQAHKLGSLLIQAAEQPSNNSFKPKPLRGSA